MTTKTYKRINENGYIVEDVSADVAGSGIFDASTLVKEDVPIGIVLPKWEGDRWIEGMTSDLSAMGVPDWQKLQSALRGSIAFGKAMQTSNTNGWALLLFALGTSRSVDDLNFAIAQVRAGMGSDFTPEEIEFINTALDNSGFNLRVD